MEAGLEGHPRRQSRLSPDSLSGKQRSRARCAGAQHERQDAAADRRGRHQPDRRGFRAAAGIREGRARLHRRARRTGDAPAGERQAEARARGEGRHAPHVRRARRVLGLLQHGGPDDRRHGPRAHRAAPRHRACDRHGNAGQGRLRRAGDRGQPDRAADDDRLRSDVAEKAAVRPGGGDAPARSRGLRQAAMPTVFARVRTASR